MVTLKIIKTRIIIAVLLFLSIWLTYQYMESMFFQSYIEKDKFPSELSDSKKLTVTVYYECLCPDSKSFILNHLLPSYEKAHHLLKLDLIPYGKAETKKTSRGYEFDCQHGPPECFGNKVHACAIEKVRDQMKCLKLISCLMEDNGSIENVGAECAKQFGVPWSPILECANGREGGNLLKNHGESTDALSPKISFVPTILLNHNRDGQPAILKNLWKEICKVLPESVPDCH